MAKGTSPKDRIQNFLIDTFRFHFFRENCFRFLLPGNLRARRPGEGGLSLKIREFERKGDRMCRLPSGK